MEYVPKNTYLEQQSSEDTVVSTELTLALGYPNYEDKQDIVKHNEYRHGKCQAVSAKRLQLSSS